MNLTIRSLANRLVCGLLAWLLFLTQHASALQISLMSDTNFWTDLGTSQQSDHVSVGITNADGVTYSNLWVTIGSFTNSSVQLGSAEPGQYPLGKLANNRIGPAFFYVQANINPPNNGSYNNQFTVKVFNGYPSDGVLLVSSNFPLIVQGSIKASANKVNAVTITPTNNPVVGGTVKISVFGDTGGVGSGNLMDFTPASYTNWNAGVFQLVTSVINVSNSAVFAQGLTNTLTATANSHFTGNNNLYEADYWFRVVGTTGTNTTPTSPISYIQSGGQTKHTDLSSGVILPPLSPATNLTTLNSLVRSTQLYTNQVVTFTLAVSNLSTVYSVTLDRLVDALPTGFVYVANSSTFGGAPVLDPTNASQILTWSQGGTYTVPTGASSNLVFKAVVPGVANPAYFTNSCVGYVENFLIGTNLANPGPATEVVRALIAPIAGNTTNTTALENQTLSVSAPGVLINTVEPNGFTATVVANSQPANGSVTVNANGSYTYTPAPFFWGWDSFTFVITNSNFANSTATNYVYVNHVNQPPTLNAISNLSLVENWNLQTVALSGITPGPTNESSQTLTITATSSNPSLIPNPTVNYTNPATTGSLTFTPTTNSFGTALITVVVQDNGGTANGGVDSVTNTFSVSVVGLTNYWYSNSNLTVNLSNALGGPNTGFSQTNYLGVLSVPATTTNPFVIKLTGPATNFNYASNYTWTIATTTRGVINFLNTNQVIVDTSAFTNDLAGGFFTVEPSGDGSSVLLVYTGNLPPVAYPITLGRAIGTSLKISIPLILTNYTSDPNGDARTFLGAGASTNGAYISTNSAFIWFAPVNNIPESFTYAVRDSRTYRPGDTVYVATNWITVVVTNAVGNAQAVTGISTNGVSVRFAGVPGYAYDIQRATNVTGPWLVIATTNAPGAGVWIYTDGNPPQPSAYYRTAQH